LLDLLVTKRRLVVVEQACATGDVCFFILSVGGRCNVCFFILSVGGKCRTVYMFVLRLRKGSVPAEGGCCVISGGGSAVLAAVSRVMAEISGAGLGISGTGVGVSGAEGRVPEAGVKAVPLGAVCSHLLGEVIDFLLECWGDAGERWLDCDLRDGVCTVGCSVQAALFLTSKEGLYVGDSQYGIVDAGDGHATITNVHCCYKHVHTQ
jgi:hypothetical protein